MRTPGSRALGLPRAVWLLGWVSLATDAASEAIYPLLPFFLTQVLGAGVVSLGIVEGAAEAANSVLKVLSGRIADRSRSKRPLVLAGYALSSLARPLIALATTWTHVFTIRVIDRVGKGIRGAPRDALLAEYATERSRGKVFGFHRAMDHAGAVIGPVLASAFLLFYPGEYRTLFALAIVPGAIAVGLIFLVREPGVGGGRADNAAGSSQSGDNVRLTRPASNAAATPMPKEYTRFMVVMTLFTLGNSTDAFLLLRLTEAAGTAKYVPLMWAALHVVKASTSVVGGIWSDRVGRRAVIASGWLVYAAVYAGFAVSTSLAALFAWFLVYGLHFGLVEGTERALIADLAPASRRGFAYGVFTAVQGLGALAASVIFGLVWASFGAATAFGLGAALAIVAAALLASIGPRTAGPARSQGYNQ